MVTTQENTEQIFMPVKGSKDYFCGPGFLIECLGKLYMYITEEM